MELRNKRLMDFIDLKEQYKSINKEINASISRVLDHGKYIMGPEVEALEEALKKYTNSEYCISCSSGTDALLMSLLALDVKSGDIILTTPFTFIATAEVIALTGATPVFIDIDPKTFNIDHNLIEDKIQEILSTSNLNIKGIIPVNIFGLPCDYNQIHQICEKYNIPIIEDAAQSFGAKYYDKISCNLSVISCTSFFPAKPLGCYGDGGAIFTNNQDLYERLFSIRVHGKGKNKYDNVNIGINGRLDTIQAAILIEKLKIFSSEIVLRQKVANRYRELLQDHFILQHIPDHYMSTWAQFSILADDGNSRDIFIKQLKDNNIPSAIYYPKPLHLQPAFKNLNLKYSTLLHISEDISGRIFSIPMHPYLSNIDIDKITNILIEAKNEL